MTPEEERLVPRLKPFARAFKERRLTIRALREALAKLPEQDRVVLYPLNGLGFKLLPKSERVSHVKTWRPRSRR